MSTSISILGNTGRDVELRYTQQGTPVANFSIASNSVRNTAQGQQKKTDWFNVSAFGKQAETLAKYLNKGASILIHGKLTFKPWLSREGEARVSADVLLQDFEFAGGNAVKTTHEAAPNVPPANENNRADFPAVKTQTLTDEAAEKDEMLPIVYDVEVCDEEFAGQF